ncbi:hypothetical protein [Oceanicola sp. S124]|uniref:hypothetical protein n=1 Tax=Oceanicola sp. S124 TaxID=1042378 RepID=UPI00025578FF|nr:hypothetical protein [Oceanicola sp. S124]
MQPFPADALRPLAARLSGQGNDWSLVIDFARFQITLAPEGPEEQPVALAFENPFRGDGVELGTDDLAGLIGRSLAFPRNPEDGYIDGSVYFFGCHNPVDVTRLDFAPDGAGGVMLGVESRWLMSFEGTGFADFDYSFKVPLVRPGA